MQLGGNKIAGGLGATSINNNIAADWALEAAAEASTGLGFNPWGNDDLMDVNADEDDWSKYCFVEVRLRLTHPRCFRNRSGAGESFPCRPIVAAIRSR